MIIKTKFYCKNGAQESKGGRGLSFNDVNWVNIFIEGKWYDGEYETWPFESGFRLNGGWKVYWVVNESGVKTKISRARMGIIFELDHVKLRDIKIDTLLK